MPGWTWLHAGLLVGVLVASAAGQGGPAVLVEPVGPAGSASSQPTTQPTNQAGTARATGPAKQLTTQPATGPVGPTGADGSRPGLLVEYAGLRGPVGRIAVSGDGLRLAGVAAVGLDGVGEGREVLVWCVETGALQSRSLVGAEAGGAFPTSVAFVGERLAVGTADGRVFVDGAHVCTLPDRLAVQRLHGGADGSTLWAAGGTGAFRIEPGPPVRVFRPELVWPGGGGMPLLDAWPVEVSAGGGVEGGRGGRVGWVGMGVGGGLGVEADLVLGEPGPFAGLTSLCGGSGTVVTGEAGGTVRLHRLGLEGSSVQTSVRGGAVTALDLSGDGGRLAVGTAGGVTSIYGREAGEITVEFAVNGHAVTDVRLSPCGRTLFVGSTDGLIRAWDASVGQQLASYRFHGRAVRCVAVSPGDGRLVATGDEAGHVRVWLLDSGEVVEAFEPLPEAVCRLEFGSDGSWLLAATLDGRLWRIARQTGDVTEQGGGGPSAALRGERRFRWLLDALLRGSGAEPALLLLRDGFVLLQDGEGASRSTMLEVLLPGSQRAGSSGQGGGEAGQARSVAVTGGSVLVGTSLWRVLGYEAGVLGRARSGRSAQASEVLDGFVLCVAADERAGVAVAGTASGSLYVLDLPGLGTRSQIAAHQGPVRRILLDAGRNRLVSIGDDGLAQLWELGGLGRVLRLKGHLGWIHDAAFSRDARRLITVGEDGTVRVWGLPQ